MVDFFGGDILVNIPVPWIASHLLEVHCSKVGPGKPVIFVGSGEISPLFRAWSNHRHPFISPFIEWK